MLDIFINKYQLGKVQWSEYDGIAKIIKDINVLRLVLSALMCTFLLGCSTPNSVNRIVDKDSVIKYRTSKGNEHRFQNLYSVKKLEDRHYPVTCEQDCYPDSIKLRCEENAENCTFMGVQEVLDLDLGFDIQWLGHASFHVKTNDGTSLLLDPVTQQFDWPIGFAHWLTGGIYRNNPEKWLPTKELEAVDAVMYSHVHYDHFNKADVDDMNRDIEYLVPLGFAEHFENDNYRINEMAWFSSTKIKETDVHFVPANHFSNRILVPYVYEDRDTSLWGAWIIEKQGKKLFFAGDTGYSNHFKDIHERYGDMDVCLMPIASYYHPDNGNWYRYVHLTPEDALVAADEMNCKVMIPWGYGKNSWQMGDKSSYGPLFRLLKMHKQLDSEVPLHILNEGEKVRF